MNIKKIQGFENYSVSDCGKVFDRNGKEMTLQVNIDGYYVVNLISDEGNFHRRVNRLVAIEFLDNPESLPVVHHKDHNKLNNHISNLEWTTVKQNTLYSVEAQPEKHKGNADIDKATAVLICESIQQGMRNKEISEKLNVPIDCVKHIRRGNTWKEVSKDYVLVKSARSISEVTARWVCHKIKEGYKNSEIVKMSSCPNVTRTLVKAIRVRKTWAWLSKDIF
jgi:hypothetical protein